MTNINNLSVYITGASSGIGKATALAFAKQGANLVLIARRKEKIDELAQLIKTESHVDVIVIDADITNKNELFHKTQSLLKSTTINILVNNAGSMLTSFVDEFKVDEWQQMINININGVLNMIDLIYPTMIKQKSGHIINIGSLAGLRTIEGNAIYSISKYGIHGFSDALRKEAINHGIRVTEILPGSTESELLSHITSKKIKEKLKSNTMGFHGKKLEACDIANAIVYASSQPKHVTISELVIRPATAKY